MKISIKYLFLLILSLFLVACGKDPEIITLSGKTMGTTYHIKYIDNGKVSQQAEQTHEQIEVILKKVNDQMSTYIPTSELSRFNQNTQVNQSIEISPELGKVMAESIRLNKLTDGALDVTVGPLVNLWGFGPDKRLNKQPSQQQLNERLAKVGIDKLKLSQRADKFSLEKSIPELYVDLSSIAKGYGVDQVADYLDQLHIANYLVEIGGEIRAKGKNAENKDWQIAIEQPNADGSRSAQKIVGLKNLGMATSGDYRNYFEQNGIRYSHEIDPKTGYPVQHNLASITVLHPSAMTADGLSTGLFVLGEQKALEIAEQQGIAIYMIIKTDKGFETKMSSKFTALLAEQHQ
ncbi:FAD:protein FMN transferase [Lonepinella sp. BR2357]|uniref:FAD:protein FMN transferase n=1 Tax=Lonepinella sp. BR2357 TaxID=3434549 RepID=UPI003F6E17C4